MMYKCVPAIYRIIVLLFHEAGTPQPWLGSEIRQQFYCGKSDYSDVEYLRNKYPAGFYTYSSVGILFCTIILLLGEKQCCFLRNH